MKKVIENLKKANEKITSWYKSNPNDLNKTGLIVLAVICGFLSTFFWFIYRGESGFCTVLLLYLCIEFGLLAVASLIMRFYAFGIRKSGKDVSKGWPSRICIFLFKFYLAIVCVLAIPMMLAIMLFQIIVLHRAKSEERFAKCVLLVFIDFFAILWLIDVLNRINLSLIINSLFVEKLQWEVSKGTIYLFVILALAKIVIDIFTILFCLVVRRVDFENYKKTHLPQDTKLCKIDFKEKFEGDKKYYKHTMWRIQLVFLVFFFAIATFSNPDTLLIPQGDIINVVTLFTLFMLVSDKKKEWE